VQLGLYIDVLERLGFGRLKIGYIWDVHGQEVKYDFMAPRGPRTPGTLWDLYQEILGDVRRIINEEVATRPALASCCKLCPWRKICKEDVANRDDLTLIFELGREKRDSISKEIATVNELAKIDVAHFVEGKKTRFPGIGPASLEKFSQRAALLKTSGAQAFLKNQILLPRREIELFFDIETDPMRDICYLHGFIERRNGDTATQKYFAFLAEEPNEAEEKKAFEEAWQ
jgi:predicted RecB family nuclease